MLQNFAISGNNFLRKHIFKFFKKINEIPFLSIAQIYYTFFEKFSQKRRDLFGMNFYTRTSLLSFFNTQKRFKNLVQSKFFEKDLPKKQSSVISATNIGILPKNFPILTFTTTWNCTGTFSPVGYRRSKFSVCILFIPSASFKLNTETSEPVSILNKHSLFSNLPK